MVPLWLIENPKVGRHAYRLLVRIRVKHEDWDTHTFTAPRRELAAGINVPLSTLDKALAQLDAAGVVTHENQKDEDGNWKESLYRVWFDGPAPPEKRGLYRKLGIGGATPKKQKGAIQKTRSTRDPTSLSDHRSTNLKAPRADAPARPSGKRRLTKKPRPPDRATFRQAVVIVTEVRRQFPDLADGTSLADAVKRERIRLGFVADEFDERKLTRSQVHRAIDAEAIAHPRPRLVLSRYRPPPEVDPISRRAAPDVLAMLERHLGKALIRTMPPAAAQPGVTVDREGNVTRACSYRVLKNYDFALGLTPRAADLADTERERRSG
jgi:hypothetical protein